MHGSLLPHYRGRAPVNWAVLHNEKESGATLHVMTEKPDQGAIVGQKAVPILPNDTAAEVMQKVTVAAELCLYEVIGPLLQGTILHRAQILTQGSYFSGRQREDGRINWQLSAQKIHHLVRAVAPPYPGAFFDYHLQQITILRTRVLDRIDRNKAGKMMCEEGNIYAASYDGSLLRILAAQIEDKPLSAKNWEDFFSTACITL